MSGVSCGVCGRGRCLEGRASVCWPVGPVVSGGGIRLGAGAEVDAGSLRLTGSMYGGPAPSGAGWDALSGPDRAEAAPASAPAPARFWTVQRLDVVPSGDPSLVVAVRVAAASDRGATVGHLSCPEAMREAERLCRKEGVAFAVMEVIGIVEPPKPVPAPPVSWVSFGPGGVA